MRTLLRLPAHEEEGGCNLTTASLAFNLIAGASVLFYEASPAALADRGDRSRRFRDVLRGFYPWGDRDLATDDAVVALYDWARNPLSHSFGVTKDPRTFPGVPAVQGQARAIVLAKAPLPPDAIEILATARVRPEWLEPTIHLVDGAIEISVTTLAWGTHELFRRLFEDDSQASAAESTAATLRGR